MRSPAALVSDVSPLPFGASVVQNSHFGSVFLH